MNAKDHHKELKKKVNILEEQRRNDRSSTLWTQIKEMKYSDINKQLQEKVSKLSNDKVYNQNQSTKY